MVSPCHCETHNMRIQISPLVFTASVFAVPATIFERVNCPSIHVFGARETTASAGYGSAGTVVNEILNVHTGSTAEAISYPACGGGASCGGISYSSSVAQGTSAVVSQVGAFAKQCPGTELVLVGYSQVRAATIFASCLNKYSSPDSQGSEIIDNALCGGGDPNQGLASTGSIASYNIKAVIFMGNPRFEVGAPYNVGTCKAGGVSRPVTSQRVLIYLTSNNRSLTLVLPVRLVALTTTRSSRTATHRIHIAATAVMRLLTRGMGQSMDKLRSLL
jgi:acetylxylan esterase